MLELSPRAAVALRFNYVRGDARSSLLRRESWTRRVSQQRKRRFLCGRARGAFSWALRVCWSGVGSTPKWTDGGVILVGDGIVRVLRNEPATVAGKLSSPAAAGGRDLTTIRSEDSGGQSVA